MSLHDDECQYCGFRFVEQSELNAAFAMLANFNPGADEFTAALDVLRNHIATPAIAGGGDAVAGVICAAPFTDAEWTEYGHSLAPGTPLFTHPTGAVQVTDDALNTEYTRGRCDGFDAACNPITYKNQPDNVGAWRLGEACRNAKPGGDLIDHGLSLLKELQEKGYGVVALNPGGSRE